MKDKICLITGGTSGVGYATALGLARLGGTIEIVSRNEQSGNRAVEALKRKSGNNNVGFFCANLSEPDSIRMLAEDFLTKYEYLHLLSNNAALLPKTYQTNSKGYEITFATSYLSHFLITNLLLEILKKSAPSRVITVSGNMGLVKHGKIYFNDIHLKQSFNPIKALLQATLAKVTFSIELAKRLDNSGVTSNTFHPGIVRSKLGRNLPFPINLLLNFGMNFIQETCRSAVFLASDEKAAKMNGIFYENGKAREFKSKYYTRESAQKLWELSTTLCNLN